MWIYVGDTHGYLHHVERLIYRLQIEGYLDDHKLVFLGDYLDRGPEVRGLLQLCIDLKKQGHIFLMGNHEYAFLRTACAPDSTEERAKGWCSAFGSTTLTSFGIRDKGNPDFRSTVKMLYSLMSKEEKSFIKKLQYYHESNSEVAIHSGLLAELPWEEQKARLGHVDFETHRCPDQLDERGLRYLPHGFAKMVVSGHEIVGPEPIISGSRAMIDTGIYRYGCLTAFIPDCNKVMIADDSSVICQPM